jgi:NAD(P)-dependent dehydrogenase (short-subunit alcohol dehydrogenase family)
VAVFVRRVEYRCLVKGAKVAINECRREVVAKAVRPKQTGSAEIRGIGSDVATAEGCVAALEQALTALGGLDVQANNAGAVRVGRRENTDEAELQAMIDATAPILLPPAAPSAPQQPRCHVGECLLCYIAGWRAVLGDVCTVKAVLADFGEAPRREFKKGGHPCPDPLYPRWGADITR